MIPTGTHINYYFVCARKLWMFAHGIACEHESDAVRMGKFIHETTYERENKEIDIDGTIVLDRFDAKTNILHEVKKSDKMEEAHEWQLLYYLYYLKTKGTLVASDEQKQGVTGELNYPTLRKTKKVILTPEKELYLKETIIPEIEKIIESKTIPSAKEIRACKQCSYSELCYC
jgi:CRISPR-associated exonuclease Cas4